MPAIQNHIHLATALGSAPENAPLYRWSVTAYNIERVGFWNVEYTLNGKRHFNSLLNNGTPVVKENYQYSILCKQESGYTAQERIRQLYAMRGRVVYVTHLYHANDDADHTADTVQMFLDEVQGEEPLDTLMNYVEVKVSLIDIS